MGLSGDGQEVAQVILKIVNALSNLLARTL